jgi:uncharacterized protein YrrD
MEFGQKFSITAFKTKHNTDRIDVVKNPINGKLFMSANGKTLGSVSKNYDSSKDKEVVELIIAGGVIIPCLHNPSATNVIETL